MYGIEIDDARAPDGMRLYAIGDVHGRLDLLSAMHGEIGAELARDGCTDWRVIHLGDYVDRGPDSKGVLDFLIAARERDPRHIALTGNHDIGFLDFLAEPDADGLFMRYGGVQTARSYGVTLREEGSWWPFRADDRLSQGHAALVRAVPPAHVAFLRSLPLFASFGDFFFCHAGIRPGVPLSRQRAEDLVWIREQFHYHREPHEKIVVHGHTPVPRADVRTNRVNVDTGAFESGMLTALAVDGAEKRILTVRA